MMSFQWIFFQRPFRIFTVLKALLSSDVISGIIIIQCHPIYFYYCGSNFISASTKLPLFTIFDLSLPRIYRTSSKSGCEISFLSISLAKLSAATLLFELP